MMVSQRLRPQLHSAVSAPGQQGRQAAVNFRGMASG
jgi:hypothetical protein